MTTDKDTPTFKEIMTKRTEARKAILALNKLMRKEREKNAR